MVVVGIVVVVPVVVDVVGVVVDVGVVVVVVVVVQPQCDELHESPEEPFTAWTSTQCPPQFTLCGWLLPGPYSFVPAWAPRSFAICAAVLPLP